MKRTLGLTLALLSMVLPATAAAQNAAVSSPLVVQAASANVTLSRALQAALGSRGVTTAQATLSNAQATLNATKNDPSALVVAKTQAQQAADLATVNLQAAKLSALQSAIGYYVALLNAQKTVEEATLQVSYDQKNLQVAQVQLSTGNATALTVRNAQTTLNKSTQSLADARAQILIAAQNLANLTGLPTSTRVTDLTDVPGLKTSLASLQNGLSTRLPSVVQATQAVQLAQLNVSLYNNDFTAPRTLADAKVTLDNAQRTLTTTTKNATATLADSYQTASNAIALLAVAYKTEANALTSYNQAQVQLQNGLISSVALLQAQVTLKSAQVSRVAAQGTVLTALAALSVAAGTNVTGISGI